MTETVLDASALLAFLNDEPGSDKVQSCLDRAVISAVNLSEAASVLIRIGMPEQTARSILADLPLKVVAFDDAQALAAAALFPATRPAGLSLGDRACLALAQSLGATALTADRAWSNLKLGIKIETIRV
ncbi:MAG: type II toxin-antitoxin system VapC family toxin [Rhodospirillales bacterium]|nr:type II toxin-antitoxin system VapC family toxin [Rhodospirillales bacterium]